jgi:hypothetical protein
MSWVLTFLFLGRGLAVDEGGDLKDQRFQSLFNRHRPDLEIFWIPGEFMDFCLRFLPSDCRPTHHRAAMDPTISAIVILKFLEFGAFQIMQFSHSNLA